MKLEDRRQCTKCGLTYRVHLYNSLHGCPHCRNLEYRVVLKSANNEKKRIEELEEVLIKSLKMINHSLEMFYHLKKELQIENDMIKQQRDIAVEFIEKNTVNPYPDTVFLRTTKEQWDKANKMLQKELGFPIDRISAEYGRIFRDPVIKDAKQALKKIEELEK